MINLDISIATMESIENIGGQNDVFVDCVQLTVPGAVQQSEKLWFFGEYKSEQILIGYASILAVFVH